MPLPPGPLKDGEDPYRILGLSDDADTVHDESVVRRAYRKLALHYHPDKQQSQSSGGNSAEAEIKFAQLSRARAFLLEDEWKEHVQKWQSGRLAKHRESQKRAALSGRKRRMAEELERAQGPQHQQQKKNKSHTSTTSTLSRQGAAWRQAYATKMQPTHTTKNDVDDDFCQVRLKWSRRKMPHLTTTASIRQVLEQELPTQITVQRVEMLQENSALITVASATQATTIVQHLAHHDALRARPVGKARQDSAASVQQQQEDEPGLLSRTARDKESVSDWKLRRELARETTTDQQQSTATCFPLRFPPSNDASTPMEQLKQAEMKILKPLVTEKKWNEMIQIV